MRTMSKSHFYLIIPFFLFTTVSCLEKIDLFVEDGLSEAIVIDGRLVKGDPSVVGVSVTRLFDFNGDARKLVIVDDARISDEEGNEMELTKVGLYNYYAVIGPDDLIKIRYGKSYKISITTQDGQRYESSLEMLVPGPSEGELNVEVVEAGAYNPRLDRYHKIDQLQLLLTTGTKTDFGPSKMLFEFMRTWRFDEGISDTCYVTDNVVTASVQTVNGGDHGTDLIIDKPMIQAPIDTRLDQGAYFSVIRSSLSDGAFEYWSNAAELYERTGNMFEPTIGHINSNFTNLDDPEAVVYGYFFATESDTLRIKVDESLTGPLEDYCASTRSLICGRCRSTSGTTFEKPLWWK